ncbi:MAG: PEP-CTERM system TPR-repeat protein PrsT [Gammaproteobacteria bacterium]|nr:PEP-CTERM system TPR-repeat protein PrsT [Gammaproteobacteria bacterium]
MQSNFVLRHPPSLLLLGIVRYRLGELDEAHDLLSRFVEMEPYHMDARKLLAGLQLRRGLAPQTLETLEPVFKARPDDVQTLVLTGRAYMRLNEVGKANELLERAVRLAPKQADIRAQLAMGWLAEGKRAEAASELERAIELGSGANQAGALLGISQIREGDVAGALTTAQRLLARWPDDASAHNFSGVVALAAQRPQQARGHFERAIQLNPQDLAALHNLATMAVEGGDAKSAIARYNRILAIDRDNIQAMRAMADIARAQERSADAIEWLERVLAADITLLAPQLELLDLYLAKESLSQAWHLVQSMQDRFPREVAVRVASGRVELASGAKTRVQETFKRLVKSEWVKGESGSAPRLLEYAKYLLVADDVDAAREALESAAQRAPQFLPVQVMFAELALQAGQFERALARVNAVRQQDPEAAIADQLAGDALLGLGRVREAKAAFATALVKGAAANVAFKLFQVRQFLGETDVALRELEQWVAQHEQAVAARRVLGGAYIEAQRFDAARWVYEELNEQYPGDALILNNLAVLYVLEGDARGLEFAQRAYAFAPEHAAILDTLGWALVKAGKITEALPFLRDAFTRASSNVTIRYHLAAALAQVGRADEAKQELQAVLDTGETFFEVAQAKELWERLSN